MITALTLRGGAFPEEALRPGPRAPDRATDQTIVPSSPGVRPDAAAGQGAGGAPLGWRLLAAAGVSLVLWGGLFEALAFLSALPEALINALLGA